MLSPNQDGFLPKKQLSTFFSNKYIILFFSVVFCLRLVMVLIPPQFTTDLARSLFYGKHFWSIGFDVYNLTPIQIDPNFNIIDQTTNQLAWPGTTYDYGVLSLFYYALVSLISVNISTQMIIAKLLLNTVDIIIVIFLILLYPENKEIPIIFWVVMIPFSSIEGQPLSFTLLFFVLSIYFYKNNHKSLAYLLVALGFHWKYVTLMLLPFYVLNDSYQYYQKRKNHTEEETQTKQFITPFIVFLVSFLLLMFPLLFSRYILNYISFGGNLPVNSLPWNPFYIGYPFTFSSYILAVFVLYILYSWLNLRKTDQLALGLGFIPLLGLFGFLLIYKYAFPWYWMWSLPLFSLVPLKRRKIFLIFLGICCVAAIEFINWTVGFPFIENLLFFSNS